MHREIERRRPRNHFVNLMIFQHVLIIFGQNIIRFGAAYALHNFSQLGSLVIMATQMQHGRVSVSVVKLDALKRPILAT